MRALDKKLFRDLWGMKGQALAIAMVIASGIATFIMSVSTLDSLILTQFVFYRDYRFADIFASLTRAPESLRGRIQEIPGVQHVETRVFAPVMLDIEGYPDPVSGLIVSLPGHGEPLLNRVYIRQGRALEPLRDDEVLLSEAFAEAHGFRPGDRLQATIRGKKKRLRIVGIALSPEFIYQLQPGAVIPDFETYGILWMARTPLSAAFDMEGAFNAVALTLLAGAREGEVIDRLDGLLARYGSLGAHGRKDQISHRFLSEEMRQLQNMATMFPIIFISVAAFLLNVVVGRLMATQREQVAILKAFGYTNGAVVAHYLKLISLIVLLGVAGGIAAGVWMGQGLSRLYMDFYRFPFLLYQLRPAAVLTAAFVTSGAAFLGTLYSVVRAALLPPAQAMQPSAPARFRVSLLERLGLKRALAPPTKMIVRSIERRPIKALLTVIGIAFACAILVVGRFFSDAMDYMVTVQFKLATKEDLSVTFVEPVSAKVLYSLRSLQGVEYAEPFRSVAVRLRFQHRSYRTSIRGVPPGASLYRLLDRDLQPVEVAERGLLLTDHLAKILGIRPGEVLTVEVLEGNRRVLEAPVTGLVSEWVGVAAYTQLESLNRMLGEGPAISGAYLDTDPRYQSRVYSELKEMPRVAGANVREKGLRNFYETMAKQMLTFAFFNTLLACSIAFGVVYNSARIAFSERSRDLASLRVLGFTRGEISYILLGEMALLTLIAIPVGFLIGRALCAQMITGLQTDLFRIPLIIEPGSYSFAAIVVLASGIVSGLAVKRKLDRLDLVAVLKTKE
jgi:putative ABC transport system permease protein